MSGICLLLTGIGVICGFSLQRPLGGEDHKSWHKLHAEEEAKGEG